MANIQISAVDIERIWYADYTEWKSATDITGADVKTLLEKATTKKVKNVHQDTWQIEESEASQDKFKNQLTGNVYRMGAKEMGEVTVQFTIGRYDYQVKADLLGGTVVKKGGSGTDKDEAVGWKRARGIVELKKILIARTEDKQYVVFPQANFNVRESNTDKAIGLAVSATAMEPDNDNLPAECWFDQSAVGTLAETAESLADN